MICWDQKKQKARKIYKKKTNEERKGKVRRIRKEVEKK